MQAADKAAHERVIVTLPGQFRRQPRGFEFGNQYFVVAVHQQMQRGAVRRTLAQAHVTDMEGEYLIFWQPCELRVQVKTVADQVGEGATDQFTGWQAQPVLDVFTGLQHAQVGGVQHQQETVGLDAARHVDRFTGTALHASASVVSAVINENAPVMSVHVWHWRPALEERAVPYQKPGTFTGPRPLETRRWPGVLRRSGFF